MEDLNFEKVYESNAVKKLKEYYFNSLKITNYYDSLVNFIASIESNNLSWARTEADQTLHRQGKNRKISDTNAYRLSMRYELEDSARSDINELYLDIFSQFLIISNAELEQAKEVNNKSAIKFTKNSVKTLILLIFNANLYQLLSKLKLPNYVTNSVNNIFTLLSQGRFNVFNQYKESLKLEGYSDLIEIVNQIGMDDFFEIAESKAKSMFDRFFRSVFDKTGLTDKGEYQKLLSQYEAFRNLYRNYTDKLIIKDLAPYFNQSDSPYSINIYDHTKSNVIEKINNIANNLGDSSLINNLVCNENR